MRKEGRKEPFFPEAQEYKDEECLVLVSVLSYTEEIGRLPHAHRALQLRQMRLTVRSLRVSYIFFASSGNATKISRCKPFLVGFFSGSPFSGREKQEDPGPSR